MGINKLLQRELKINDSFSYYQLYNDSRGAVNKDIYKALLKHCISEQIIVIKKYLVMENVHPDTFYDIVDQNNRESYHLKERLKEYHQEGYYRIAPFVYLLELLEPKYRINNNIKEYDDPLLEFPNNIKIGYHFEGTNAFSRLYLEDDKIAINSSNDNIDNLMDTLEIDGITVYILDVEENINSRQQNIVVYKLTKSNKFNQLKNKAEYKCLDELRSYQNKL